MKIHIVGDSHAPIIFRAALQWVGGDVVEQVAGADLVLISQDTPTDAVGNRNLSPIIQHVYETLRATDVPVILTSQVTPGFCRQFNTDRLYHQAETLRIVDAFSRAMQPEQLIIGKYKPYDAYVHQVVQDYLALWGAMPDVVYCSYEDAEFAKIAINVTLAHQVTLANALSVRASAVGAKWDVIRRILANDSRIGPDAYTKPGDWRRSPHLLRDYHWFNNEASPGDSATSAT